MKSYKELIVWQKAMALVLGVYRVTQTFPPAELYGLGHPDAAFGRVNTE
ncbi:MAG: four helix bundle protein [Terriglobales bacterium]